jgi:hypothetical protein
VLSASQAAAGNYTAATATTSFEVMAAVVLDFTLSAGQSQSQTIQAGGTATYSLQIAPTATAYPADVTFTTSGVPVGATYSFSPATVAVNAGATTVTFTVNTAATTAMGTRFSPGNTLERRLAPIALGILFLPFAGVRRIRKQGQKRARLFFMLLCLLGGTMSLIGCGGGSSQSGGTLPSQTQSYTITITATSGTVLHSTSVTLQVQ